MPVRKPVPPKPNICMGDRLLPPVEGKVPNSPLVLRPHARPPLGLFTVLEIANPPEELLMVLAAFVAVSMIETLPSWFATYTEVPLGFIVTSIGAELTVMVVIAVLVVASS